MINKVENKNDGLLISNVGGMKEKSLISCFFRAKI